MGSEMCIRDRFQIGQIQLRDSRLLPLIAALEVADKNQQRKQSCLCLLYTSDAADERSSVDLGGRRIIKKKKTRDHEATQTEQTFKSIEDLCMVYHEPTDRRIYI